MGDTLGCLFEFKNNIGHLTFLKNGVSNKQNSIIILLFSRHWVYALIIFQRVATVQLLASITGRYK